MDKSGRELAGLMSETTRVDESGRRWAGLTEMISGYGVGVGARREVPVSVPLQQFPVKVCFAMSINKSQGQSVKHVGLDLRNAVFTHGQLYVAVSQVTSVCNIKAIWDSNLVDSVTKNIVYPEVIIL